MVYIIQLKLAFLTPVTSNRKAVHEAVRHSFFSSSWPFLPFPLSKSEGGQAPFGIDLNCLLGLKSTFLNAASQQGDEPIQMQRLIKEISRPEQNRIDGLFYLTGLTCILHRLRRTHSNLDPFPAETIASVYRTIRFVPFFSACAMHADRRKGTKIKVIL